MRAGKNLSAALGSTLHVISAYVESSSREASWRSVDFKRVLAHLASIPLVLREELRQSRDLSILKGLLSAEDVGKIECSENMTKYCVDVVRSYYFRALCHPDATQDSPLVSGGLPYYHIGSELANLDTILSECLFVSRFQISPAALILLRLLLGVWFFIIPFVLAEKNGMLIKFSSPSVY